MEIKPAVTPQELEAVFPVIQELRPHLTLSKFLALVQEARTRDQFEILACFQEQGRCLAAMGYRILYDFVHGKHLYIDDLVVTEAYRSQGLGARLLEMGESVARREGCQGMRLCTGVENEAGKKFYEREGWTLRAVAYKKTLNV